MFVLIHNTVCQATLLVCVCIQGAHTHSRFSIFLCVNGRETRDERRNTNKHFSYTLFLLWHFLVRARRCSEYLIRKILHFYPTRSDLPFHPAPDSRTFTTHTIHRQMAPSHHNNFQKKETTQKLYLLKKITISTLTYF